jgi:nucleoredoxin
MSTGLIDLLGDKLVSGTEEVAAGDALAGSKAVALYFSGHWCPPCRGFTPKLAEWYNESLKAKGLEVVFISSDRDEEGFKDYFAEMPWKALPYADRERKEKLSNKYKVQGIPTVVILNSDGTLITKDGRAAISGDPKGEDFPWIPKSLKEILASCKLVGKDGPVDASTLDNKAFALYFSGHWCPPCRGFTPQLADWYSKGLKEKLEIVFVSSDRDEDSFKEYFAEQPWLALDYANRKEKEQLSNLFGVRGIPSVVVIDKDGSTITKEGRAAVCADPEGKEFPWYPKPVQDLSNGPGSLNEAAVVVALCEAADEAAKKAVEAAMTPLAQTYIDKAKAAGEEDPEVCFMIAKATGGITKQLRNMMKLPEAGSSSPATLVLINIPDSGGYYYGPEGKLTSEAVAKFVADFEAGTLERKQLEN